MHPWAQPYASVGARFLSLVVDGLIYGGGAWVAYFIAFAVMANASFAVGMVLWAIIAIAGPVGYFWIPVARTGQTLGRKLCGVRIVQVESFSTPPGYGRAFLRYLYGSIWSLIPFFGPLVDYLTGIVDDPERRTVHDRLAKTRVIKASYDPVAGPVKSSPTAFSSNTTFGVLTVLVAVVGVSLMAAVVWPVLMVNRMVGVNLTMRADAAETVQVLAATPKGDPAFGLNLPVILPPGATSALGNGEVSTSPGNTVVVTLNGTGDGMCVKVTNPGVNQPVFADTKTGLVTSTSCDGTMPIAGQ